MGPRMHKDIFLIAIRGVDKISFEVLSYFIFLLFSKHLEIYYLDIILVFSIIYTINYVHYVLYECIYKETIVFQK